VTREPVYFDSADAFRLWLRSHAASASELVVGFHKRATGTQGMTWPEAVDEALCVGWIDGVRRRIDDNRYQIRFTPRRKGSTWSAVNIARIPVLQAAGRMTPAGIAAFEQRCAKKSRTYSYEQADLPEFSADESRELKRRKAAWAFFQSLPPSNRKKVVWWVVSAKQKETRERRFASLLQACSNGVRL